MDLRELYDINARRHPWEITRRRAIHRILAPFAFEGIRVLDLGCGDGFVARGLFDQLQAKQITGVDIHLTDELLQLLSTLPGQVHYCRELPTGGDYDLVLLLDIIEHLEDDRAFLADLVTRRVAREGRVLITVPAFQSLYSSHDEFLGHYRRYTLQELDTLATASGLTVTSSGYLFCSLLLPKLVLFRLRSSFNESQGVGQWRHGRFISHVVEQMLDLDNRLLLAARALGLKVPGLTGWVLCKKPE